MKTNSNRHQYSRDDAVSMAVLHTFAEADGAVTIHSQADAFIALTATKIVNRLIELPADTIKVSVENGWITLSGKVVHVAQQTAAVLAVRNMPGVTGVFSHITVQEQARSALGSDAIKTEIESSLHNSSLNDSNKITVRVVGSDVTLSGEIDSWTERSLAKHSAWATAGVSHVVDRMTMSF